MHELGLHFARMPAAFTADKLCRGVARTREKPPRENAVAHERRRLPCKISEYELGRVGGEVSVTIELPQRRGVHEVDVPLHQLGKRVVRTFLGIASEQFGVFIHVGSPVSTREIRDRTPRLSENPDLLPLVSFLL
jgi:hypothetical protein